MIGLVLKTENGYIDKVTRVRKRKCIECAKLLIDQIGVTHRKSSKTHYAICESCYFNQK